MFSDENLGKAIDFVNPKVNSWAKESLIIQGLIKKNEHIISFENSVVIM